MRSNFPPVVLLFIILMGSGCEKIQEDDLDASEQQTLYGLSYGSAIRHRLDVALPANRDTNTPVVIFIHGGGWVFGDKNSFSVELEQFAAAGIAAVSINYRYASNLTNTHHPDLPNDVLAAIEHVVSKAELWQVSSSRFGLVGHSAGGHLSLMTSYTLNTDGRIKACASWAGVSDLVDPVQLAVDGGPQMFSTYIGHGLQTAGDSAAYREASPYWKVHADVPPTLLVHGTEDDIIPYVNALSLRDRLTTLGVSNQLLTIQQGGHGWAGEEMEQVRSETLSWFLARL